MSAIPVEFLLTTLLDAGMPIAGGHVHTYAAGGTTPKTCWVDKDKVTPAANPVSLDANGTVLIFADGVYDMAVHNASNELVYSREGLLYDMGRSSVSSDDTTQDFLSTKLVAGTNITLVVSNPGANEIITIDTTPTVTGTTTLLENILPNTQHEVITAFGVTNRVNVGGTAAETTMDISAFTPASATPTCTCADTGDLAVGDHVVFGDVTAGAMTVCCLKVLAVTEDTSFQVQIPRNLVSPASEACTAYQAGIGDDGDASGNAQDGWTKSTALYYWRDCWAANIKAGHKYAGGFRMTSAAVAYYYRAIPAVEAKLYRGQSLVYGVWLKQKVKGGSGTARIFIETITGGVTSYTYSTSLTTAGWEYLQVTKAIGDTVDTINIGVEFNGTTSDVYYVCGGHAQIGTALATGAYMQRKDEMVVPIVKMTPQSYDNTSVVFPTDLDATGSFYGHTFDLCGECNMAFAPSVTVISLLVEGNNATVSHVFALRSSENTYIKYGPVMGSTVANIRAYAGGIWILHTDGTGWVYTITSADAWATVSFDIGMVWLNSSR